MGVKYSGSEWIARQKYGAQMSPLGGAAADLLGRMLRVEIQAAAPNYLKLMISQRTTREPGESWKRMPTLEDHIAVLRKAYG